MAERLRRQAEDCARLGSPFSAALLTRAADDFDEGGPTARLLRAFEHDPARTMLPLRLLGAVHRIVLEGSAFALAARYPSTGGDGDAVGAADSLVAAIDSHAERLAQLVARPVQTNEVGRAAALVGGFLVAARTWGLPLRVLETGASAGLNLRWDRFFYEARGKTWGDPSSPVHLCAYAGDVIPPFDVPAVVTERRGCDAAPIDPTSDEGRLILLSYTWPDQPARLRLLKGALAVAAQVPAAVDEARAVEWVRARLSRLPDQTATVVFHSIFIQYMPREERETFVSTIAEAGARANRSSPLAWVRMEAGGDETEARITMWPGGEERTLATAGYHGTNVRWRG